VVTLLPVRGIPLVQPGDDVAALIVEGFAGDGGFVSGDVLVIAQKIVSKAENRLVRLADITPSARAIELSVTTEKDPRLVELILGESREVLRARPGLLVVEDVRGFVCANAGVDRSNISQTGAEEEVALLPVDPDASAKAIREAIVERTGVSVGVVINDSHGRAWREGTVGVAIGLAGVPAVWDRRGDIDLTGYELQHTVLGIADEIAAAASLLMGPAAEGIPAVVLRGLALPQGDSTAREIQRPRERDAFR
jgi:coenzyme F420-0:L-glutamate ligase/coenzyme F420-1:gamma-L-glutamate ligase